MTYNVLAQDLLEQHPYLYQYHDKSCLDWNTRWHNLFKEIKKLNPDILCLQEVQESHIKDYFSLLETIGYGSLYKKRTGMRTEGCAVYYKTDMMNLVEYTTVEFYQRNISILNRDNVAIVAKFAPKMHPTREFVIATTHLLYNPRRQDVRLAQTQVLLSEVERISYNKKLQDSYLPIIITGDLNSTPDSALYDFLINGALNYEILAPKLLAKGTNTFGHGKVLIPPTLRITDNCQHADLVKKRRENSKITRSEELAIIKLINEDKLVDKIEEVVKEEKKLFSTGTLSHDFAFKSVYNHGDGNDEEGTTFQDEWCTVDYIFYSGRRNETKEKLKLLSRYRLPTRGELRDVRIPNSVLGSDHLSLMAKFKLEY
ncbi:hypothetical protein NQ318_009886 [Aromia moschata]|uniref:Endonuclease/exonuclease/phosphatase domain-containing protein n=1 Tax=Aromia moschata TaxID=1265417 RepID=A0AAV8Y4H1_9CUCU|nr:hypothetical protein NQ318_009886 [Aromia moschata]